MTTALTRRETAAAQDAYTAIANFFSCYGLAAARHDLRKLAKAAAGTRSTRISPANVIWYFENVETLQKAACTIHQSGFQRQAAILTLPGDGIPDLRQFAHYCGWQRGYTPWHFLPRFLGPKEFANPYWVFRKLATYATEEKWSRIFRELRDYAFFDTGFAEYDGGENILEIFLLLNKLLEAAHLVEVRVITEVDGQPLPKWKEPAAAGQPGMAGTHENTTP
ncbi:MAG TPA: hypothetical protein VGN63_01680 [Flavisolibacter sp.]|jgi:AcrR family transcriptional regulator|nr:hypothetical protein [Flavisolibacter sp.]